MRANLIDGQFGEEIADNIRKFNDFYTMSSCRDLLFHVQEHRFTVAGIENALKKLELQFIGFQLPAREYLVDFQQTYPFL